MATEPTAGVTRIRLGYWWRILERMEDKIPAAQTMKDAQLVIEQQSDLIAHQQRIIELLRADLKECSEELCGWIDEGHGECDDLW